MNEPEIRIDHRERGSKIANEILDSGVSIKWAQLPVADYIVGDYAIERKTLSDLVMSLKDGRLRRQKQAIRAYPNPIFLITGETWDGYTTMELNAITSIVRSGITCLHIENEVDAAKFVLKIALSKRTSQPLSPIAIGTWPQDEREQLVYAISVLPGISRVRAIALLDHFGSIHDIITADISQLSAVPGIGKKTATKLYELFHRQR